jgi:GTP-binding protein EngB required for normal cell division
MLPKEIEEGNIEYKRYLISNNNNRIEELTSQMNWRLIEGKGCCYYYIGVNDDGTIYNKLTNNQFKISLNILKKMSKGCNAKIYNIKKNKHNNCNWYKIKFIKNENNYNEYHILLLGASQVGKTTFLSKLITDKDDKMYIINHQHELESGLTSSINYYDYIYNNNRYLFFDTPGHSNYLKTLMKISLSISYDIVLFFSGKEWEYYNKFKQYFKNIKCIDFYKPSILLLHNILTETIIINKIKNNNVFFNILHIFYSSDGLLLSGFLKYGNIKINDTLYWNDNKIKIKSIHNASQTNVNIINNNCIATLCISTHKNINIIKNSFISNIKYKKINKLNKYEKGKYYVNNQIIILDNKSNIINNDNIRENIINFDLFKC